MDPRTSSCFRMQLGLAFVGARVRCTPTLEEATALKPCLGPPHPELLWCSSCSYKDSGWA